VTLPSPERKIERVERTTFAELQLAELRRRGFSGESVAWFLSSAYAKSKDEVCANPHLARSVLGWGVAFFAALFGYSAALSLYLDHRLAVASLVSGSVWLVLSCAWVLAHLGLARDASGCVMERMSAPNLLTLFRSLLVPLVVASIAYGHVVLAGVLFAAGGISDILDGVSARRLGLVTRLGTVMDLLVDVLFAGATFLSLVWAGLLSPWIGALVGLRYGLVLIGGAYLYVMRGPVTIRPTAFGKLSGAIIYAMILGRMGSYAYGDPVLDQRMAELLDIGFGVLLTATVVQALAIGWYNLRRGGSTGGGERIASVLRLR